ncbi:MAG: right-handed parallel beta-helix repeat-containing protein [Akkermansiaceae bacterium]|nr:right-handed parallel beta-helix repeat-containing protein [Akkermansiaceae bacterium]
MKNTDARKTLGLSPKDKPSAFLSDFDETLEYKRELVKNAPSEQIRFRYQQELLEYEAALKVVVGKKKLRANTDFIVVLLLICSISTVGWWAYQWHQKEWYVQIKIESEIAELRAEGVSAIAARKWNQASLAFEKIKKLTPDSKVAVSGLEAIEEGKIEERNQQIFYTLGESQAALEAGRWDEAESLAKSVVALAPENETAQRKLLIIIRERKKQELAILTSAISDALEIEDTAAAKQALVNLQKQAPRNQSIPDFSNKIKAQEYEIRIRHEKSDALYQQATALDTGEYSPQAMLFLEEAGRLNPKSDRVIKLYKRMGAYARAHRVPQDYPTIPEAINAARPRDIIRVAAGTYHTALYIDRPIKLIGDPEGGTIIETPASEAALITVAPTAIGTSISNISLKHLGFDHGADRFSGITIEAKNTSVTSCLIEDIAGHGIAVLDGGFAKIVSCKINQAGWDGISVYGQGSSAEITDSWCQGNLQHGIGFWKGGSGTVRKTKTIKNGLCGIVAMGEEGRVNLFSNTCSSNREAGILLSEGATGSITANTCEKNLLSGIVARGQQTEVAMNGNVTNGNFQAGIITHYGVKVSECGGNIADGNGNKQIWRDAQLTGNQTAE